MNSDLFNNQIENLLSMLSERSGAPNYIAMHLEIFEALKNYAKNAEKKFLMRFQKILHALLSVLQYMKNMIH